MEAIWWEPETRSVCVEIYNWLKLWNIEGKHYFDQDKPNVIKIPQKYLSPTLYGPKETKMGLEFDFAQVIQSNRLLKLNAIHQVIKKRLLENILCVKR